MPDLPIKCLVGITYLLLTHSEIPLIVKGKPDYALNSHLKSTRFLLIFQIIFQHEGNLLLKTKK